MIWDGGVTRTVDHSIVLTGQGLVQLNAATLVVPATDSLTSSVGTLVLNDDGATLRGPGSATITSSVAWRAGTIENFPMVGFPAQNTLLMSGPIEISTGDAKFLNGCTLKLTNTTIWSGGTISLGPNASIENYGTFEMQGGDVLTGDDRVTTFVNKPGGTVIKTGGDSTVFGAGFTNSGSLLVEGRSIGFTQQLIQTYEGATDLSGGTLNAIDGFTMDGGTLTGSGTVNGDLTVDGGEVIVLTGTTLTVTGDYTQGPAALLTIQYDEWTGWGLLVIEGDASLDGELAITDGGTNPGNPYQDVVTVTGDLDGIFFTEPSGYEVNYDTGGATKKVQVRK